VQSDAVGGKPDAPQTATGAKTKAASPVQSSAEHRAKVARGDVSTEDPSIWDGVKFLMQYLWPKDSLKMKLHVVGAIIALVSSKALNVCVPLLFKAAVDQLSAAASLAPELTPTVAASTILLGYGAARAAASLTNELRAALFATVSTHGVTKMTVELFRHLLSLDPKFHLERNTGALTRAIDRGVRSLNMLFVAIALNVVPTALEIALVIGILAASGGLAFSAVASVTLAVYVVFTVLFTQYRSRFRHQMNKFENEASSRAFDALINYDTVQSNSNVELETKKYAEAFVQQQKASLRTAWSLAALNFGQNFIFSTGLAAIMMLAANQIEAGNMVSHYVALVRL